MHREVLVEVFRQITDGWDIPAPEKMLKVSGNAAKERLPGMPYSLAENLWHTVYWQDLWLDELEGKPRRPLMSVWQGDWQSPPAKDWTALRAQFLAGLRQAKEICGRDPFTHGMESDAEALETLVRIAVHASYHCGQLNLLKRAQRAKQLQRSVAKCCHVTYPGDPGDRKTDL